MSDSSGGIEGFYEFLWPFLAADEVDRAWLDEDIGGRPNEEFLLEIPSRFGISPASTVLDAGSGKGRYACELARRFGSFVVALDPLVQNMKLAKERVTQEGVDSRVHLMRGSVTQIGLADGSVDFVWARDAFNHVDNLEQAFVECARVLRPGGIMMNYSALGTDWLEPGEAGRLARPMALNTESFDTRRMAAAIEAAGLRVAEHATTTTPGRYYEELDSAGGRYVMRLATIVAARDRAVARIGAAQYYRLVAYYTWNVYFLIGKLVYGVWVLERPTAVEDLR